MFFFTERRWQELERTLKERGEPIPSRPAGAPKPQAAIVTEPLSQEFGTVGVVALDSRGNLAAGTSTGGTTGKRWGRLTIAREVCALVQYKKNTMISIFKDEP